MATKVYTLTISGNAMNINDSSPSDSLIIEGDVTLYKVRAKRSSGGDFAFNIDASSSKSGKYPPYEDAILDIDPKQLEPVLSDGDDISDIPNNTGSNEATASSGDQPEFASSGGNITNNPAIDIGSSSKLQVSSSPPTFAAGEPFTVFVVVDEGGNSDRPALGSTNISAKNSKATWYGNNASRRTFVQDESGNSITSSGQNYFQDSDIRVLTRDSSNNVKEFRRGVETLSGTLGGTMKFSNIGWATQNVVDTATDYIFTGLSISRVIICDEYFDDDARERSEAWLAWEYGLQTGNNTYLPATHVGYQNDPITSITNSFSSDIDISSEIVDDFSSYYTPSTTTVSGSIDIITTKAHKSGTVTIEIVVTY